MNIKNSSTLFVSIRAGGGEAGKLQPPPKLGRNPFHSGKLSVRTIRNSGIFSACSPTLFDISGRNLQPPKFDALLRPCMEVLHDNGHDILTYLIYRTMKIMYRSFCPQRIELCVEMFLSNKSFFIRKYVLAKAVLTFSRFQYKNFRKTFLAKIFKFQCFAHTY